MSGVVVCLIVLLAGCGAERAFTPTVTSGPERAAVDGAPTESVAATETGAIAVSVILTDYRITSFTTTYTVGQTYVFTISNNGSVVHGFTIEAEGAANVPLSDGANAAAIDNINPGESKTLFWTFTAPGAIQLASHLNDDYARGMVKSGLTVSQP